MTLHIELLGDGEPLLVLPSFSLDHNAMAAAMEPAFSSSDGWARLYVDLPGTGSSRAVEARSDAVLDHLAATIDDHLGERSFAVAGWSYGGYLAAGLARRLHHRIRGVMVICAGFRIQPADRDLTGVLDSVPETDWLADVPPDLHGHLRHAVGCQTAEVARNVAAVLGRNGPTDETYLAALRAEGYALSDEHTATDFDAPMCLLTGRRDRVAGYIDPFRGLHRLPQADYVTLARSGHYLPIEEPYRFATIAQAWLERCLP